MLQREPAELLRSPLAVIREFVARELLPDGSSRVLVSQFRLGQRLKVFHFFGSSRAWRRTQAHLPELLKNEGGSGVPVFRVENLGFGKQKDLAADGRQARG